MRTCTNPCSSLGAGKEKTEYCTDIVALAFHAFPLALSGQWQCR